MVSTTPTRAALTTTLALALLGTAGAALASPPAGSAQAETEATRADTPAERGATTTAAPANAPISADPARTGVGFSPLSFVYTAIPVGIGVARHTRIEGTNELLRSLQLDELPELLTTVSVALTAAYPMGLVVEPMYRFSIAGTDETTLTMHQAFVNLGWLIHAHGDQVVYPYLGVGYGNTSFGVTSPGVPQTQPFYDVLRNPEGEVLLVNHSLMLQVGLASALWGSGNGDFIGLRFGAFVAPLSSGWKRRGFEVTGGPSPPMNGFYLMGNFGLHDPRWREAAKPGGAAGVAAKPSGPARVAATTGRAR